MQHRDDARAGSKRPAAVPARPPSPRGESGTAERVILNVRGRPASRPGARRSAGRGGAALAHVADELHDRGVVQHVVHRRSGGRRGTGRTRTCGRPTRWPARSRRTGRSRGRRRKCCRGWPRRAAARPSASGRRISRAADLGGRHRGARPRRERSPIDRPGLADDRGQTASSPAPAQVTATASRGPGRPDRRDPAAGHGDLEDVLSRRPDAPRPPLTPTAEHALAGEFRLAGPVVRQGGHCPPDSGFARPSGLAGPTLARFATRSAGNARPTCGVRPTP